MLPRRRSCPRNRRQHRRWRLGHRRRCWRCRSGERRSLVRRGDGARGREIASPLLETRAGAAGAAGAGVGAAGAAGAAGAIVVAVAVAVASHPKAGIALFEPTRTLGGCDIFLLLREYGTYMTRLCHDGGSCSTSFPEGFSLNCGSAYLRPSLPRSDLEEKQELAIG